MYRVLKPYLFGAGLALLLSWLSLWSGYPLVYEDTADYVNRPATLAESFSPGLGGYWAQHEKLRRFQHTKDAAASVEQAPAASSVHPGFDERIKTGRSIYYGLLAFGLSLFAGLWGIAALQAFIVGTSVTLLTVRCLGWSGPKTLALGLVLAFGTSASLMVGVVMPDVFTATLVLSLALLAIYWDRLLRFDRLFLVVVAVLSCASHDSILLLAGAMGAVFVLGRILIRRGALAVSLSRGIAATAVVCACGVLSIMTFNQMVLTMTGYPATRLPHLTSHVASLPLGVRYLDERCAQKSWAVCRFRDRLPMNWSDFLFERDPARTTFAAAPSNVKQQVSDEDFALATDLVKWRPDLVAAEMVRSVGSQLVTFSYADFLQNEKHRYVGERMPAVVADQIAKTRLWASPAVLNLLSQIQTLVAALSVVLLPAALLRLKLARKPELDRVIALSVVVVLGLVANAAICGVLASPYDRFQVRVIWLLPLVTLCAVAFAIRAGPTHAPGDRSRIGDVGQ